MLFAARKLRLHPALGKPTVIIVVDHVDLDTQVSSTFHAAGAPNLEKAGTCEELERLLAQDLARDIVEAERTTPPATPEERGKAALTELFEEVRTRRTPIMVERIVNDIDEIVRHVRFEGWQNTHAGERQVKQVLRKTLFRYRLHQDQDLFDRAYGYIRQ